MTDSPKSNAFPDKQTVDIKYETLELVQVPLVNRCFQVVCDIKARNFFALQYHPNTNMRYYPLQMKSTLSEDMSLYLTENQSPSEFAYDRHSSHDIELKYQSHSFFLNKFILLSRCPKFFTKINHECSQIDLEPLVSQKTNIALIEILIHYIYTDTCSIQIINSALRRSKVNSENLFLKFVSDFRELAADKFGLNDLKVALVNSDFSKNIKSVLNLNNLSNEEKLKPMSDLLFRLLNDAPVSSKTEKRVRKELKFSRISLPQLYDCLIECNNGVVIECHKCVLVARCEYFKNMFLGSWIEGGQQMVQLPFDVDLMQILIDYLYSDEIQLEFIHSGASTSVKSKNEREVEVLLNLYVLSDQLLVNRLKNLCEFKCANLVNLKNVVEVLEFAHQYESKQLKEFCMEFISCNLSTLIDAKSLELINMELLKEISLFYRTYYPIVESRIITPYFGGLDPAKIEVVPNEIINDPKFYDISLEDEKKKSIPNGSIFSSPQLNSHKEELFVMKVAEDAESVNIKEEKDKIENSAKWEKVKKKVKKIFFCKGSQCFI